jgi:zinc/manganese transport system substrate-binding protein
MKRLIVLLALLPALWAAPANAKLNIAASLPDLASIASYVGGDRVTVFSIARNTSDPHSVEVLPSYMVRVSRADIYLKVGLGLDQWADQIIDGARNNRIRLVDCSKGIAVLEKPTSKVDASMGDVHPDGNPHYWLDPDNGILLAQTIANALTSADPEGSATYAANLAKFQAEETRRMTQWKAEAAEIANRNIITYHSSWVYFAHAFGFEILGKLEPVPGIPPTGSHLAELAAIIRRSKVRMVLQEPYFSEEGANYLARETGVKVLKLPPSCSDSDPASYLNHFEQILSQMKAAS